jgi:VanZ family protein
MMSSTRRQALVWWTLSALVTALIYATLGIMPTIRKVLSRRFGAAIYWPVYGLIALFLLIVLVRVLLRLRRAGPLSAVVSLLVCGAYAWSLASLEIPVERFHYLEYGLLTLTVFQALRRHIPNQLVFFWGTAIVFLIGVGDETIQWWLPQRVGEYRDVLINGQASLLVQVLLAFAIRPPELHVRPGTRQLRATLLALPLAALPVLLFMLVVHSFGETIDDLAPVRFTTLLGRERLQSIDREEYESWRRRETLELLSQIAPGRAPLEPGFPWGPMGELAGALVEQTPAPSRGRRRALEIYRFEARTHLELADWLARQGLGFSPLDGSTPPAMTVELIIRRDWRLFCAWAESRIAREVYTAAVMDHPVLHPLVDAWLDSGERFRPRRIAWESPVHRTNDWLSDRRGHPKPILKRITRPQLCAGWAVLTLLCLAARSLLARSGAPDGHA